MSQHGKRERRSSQNAGKSSQKNTSITPQTSSKNASPHPATPVGGESVNREGEQSQHRAPLARQRATLLLSCLWMIIWAIIFGVILYSLQILPVPILRFAAGIAAVATVLGVITGQIIEPTAIRDFFRNIWQNANRTLSIWGGLGAVIVIFGGSYLFTLTPLGQSQIPPTPTPGQIVTPIPTAATKWVSLLKQTAPNCNNPLGAEWYVHSGGTRFTCSTSGSVLEQTTSSYYAEVDLMKVKASSYDQTNFRVQVDVAFQNPNDPSTWAALTVQSPANINIAGGYIFTVSPTGAWVLQQVVSAQSIPPVGQGTVTINPQQVVQMRVIVQKDVLSAYINGKEVISIDDNLNTSPSIVGLMVERQNAAPSSLVEFSNFELDKVG
jgi:hypothetical protein